MNQPNFEKWSELGKKVQEPLQAFTELNVKTLQGMHCIKPEELASIKSPEDLFEKQINLAVENGHKALDYMQKSFHIYEKAMLSMLADVKDKK